ncbi:MAG: hypothetical protein AAF483_26160 [Planctomycetota bacterium]
MRRSKTRDLIDCLGMWSSLLVYFLTWVATISAGFNRALLLLALLPAFCYVGMHVYEIRYRHHCYLSPDSTAFPVALIVFATLLVAFSFSGLVQTSFVVPAIGGFCAAFVLGHVAALVNAALFYNVFCWMFRRRIAREQR